MSQPRALTLGILGGLGTALLLLGVAALVGGVAAVVGAVAFDTVLSPARVVAVIASGLVGGALAGSLAPIVRSPNGAALLGAAVTIAASAVIYALDPAADSGRPTMAGSEKIALLLLPGIPGLGAPLIWAPVRIAATRPTPRAALEISVRVSAFVLAVYTALICAPVVLFAGLGIISGLVMLPRLDGLQIGLANAAGALALGAISVLCLSIAKVPRRRGPIPGFEREPDKH